MVFYAYNLSWGPKEKLPISTLGGFSGSFFYLKFLTSDTILIYTQIILFSDKQKASSRPKLWKSSDIENLLDFDALKDAQSGKSSQQTTATVAYQRQRNTDYGQ